jgi:2-C-methyl-D-erythritol 4-phosphate cytidylyltransferase
MNVCAIIPAAGASRRFGRSDKLSQDLGGRALLLRTVEAIARREEIKTIIVAGPPDEFDAFRERYAATLGFHGAQIVMGGKVERWDTVRNALRAVPADATHIAVHDAARPAVPNDLLDRLLEAARSFDAVIPACNVSATLKRVDASSNAVDAPEDDMLADAILGDAGRVTIEARRVLETVDRANLVEVQTPQVFRADLLRRAYAQPNLSGVTDDASLVERLGEPVYVIEGDVCNIKVTTPGDLRLVRAILNLKPPAERAVHKRF